MCNCSRPISFGLLSFPIAKPAQCFYRLVLLVVLIGFFGFSANFKEYCKKIIFTEFFNLYLDYIIYIYIFLDTSEKNCIV